MDSQPVRANGFLLTAQIGLEPEYEYPSRRRHSAANGTRAGKLEGDSHARWTNSLSRCQDHGVPERHERFRGNERSLREVFPRSGPARSTVQAVALPKDALVEIELIAAEGRYLSHLYG